MDYLSSPKLWKNANCFVCTKFIIFVIIPSSYWKICHVRIEDQFGLAIFVVQHAFQLLVLLRTDCVNSNTTATASWISCNYWCRWYRKKLLFVMAVVCDSGQSPLNRTQHMPCLVKTIAVSWWCSWLTCPASTCGRSHGSLIIISSGVKNKFLYQSVKLSWFSRFVHN
jgi:hypothetical protein